MVADFGHAERPPEKIQTHWAHRGNPLDRGSSERLLRTGPGRGDGLQGGHQVHEMHHPVPADGPPTGILDQQKTAVRVTCRGYTYSCVEKYSRAHNYTHSYNE